MGRSCILVNETKLKVCVCTDHVRTPCCRVFCHICVRLRCQSPHVGVSSYLHVMMWYGQVP
jgi:hypothetical protein